MTLMSPSTILLSVLLSTGGAFLITSYRHQPDSSTLIRAKSIELIDEKGNIRARLGVMKVDGHEQPEVTLLGEDGHPSVLLSVNHRGEGTLYFNSPKTEGKVGVGYLWGSDVQFEKGEDPLGLWGLRVLGRNGQRETVGIANNGKPVRPGGESQE